ncbi:MAG TPA: methyltransferase domain-containing protein [Thermoleophilaceae bacterium]|nr:methyltransferase domain-containing protein [Thermoleophilaceae bacterium]
MPYEPRTYWSKRLDEHFSLQGVGHVAYTDGYNRWLYRAKRDALDKALAGVGQGPDALDVGSGVGWVVAELRARGLHVQGCDITDVAVERLTERFPDSRFFQASVGERPLPCEDDSFDVITMMDVAYHITDDALWKAAVADLGRVLRPGGRLVVTDGMRDEPANPASHVRFRTRAQWTEAARPAGMEMLGQGSLYRWLSRDRGLRGWRRLPDGPRGAVEYALERLHAGSPHMSWASLEKQPA